MGGNKKLYKKFNRNDNYDNYDHVIIGSGIGGLTASTWLAKAGKKVLLFLEMTKLKWVISTIYFLFL